MSAQKKNNTKKNVDGSKKKKGKVNDNISSVHHIDDDLIPHWMNKERTKILTPQCTRPKNEGECVVYWMQRDMRTTDNWALLYARHIAQASSNNLPLQVVYVLPPPPPDDCDDVVTTFEKKKNNSTDVLPPLVLESCRMTRRHGDFLLGGLKLVYEELAKKNIPMHILQPDSRDSVGKCVVSYLESQKAIAAVCDFNALRHVRDWFENQTVSLLKDKNIPLYQVDAHNIVPVWYTSPKREVGARTLRPKIHKLLPIFMTHFPDLIENSVQSNEVIVPDWKACEKYLNLDETVESVCDINPPGNEAGMKRFESFLNGTSHGLRDFDANRNDPNFRNVCSNMSPYINYGQVSFQRLALKTRALKRHPNGTAAFLEEGIVRRELSDNYLYYTPEHYDSLQGAAEWAQISLQEHASDEREYIYTTSQLEQAQTHDDLWNAAQLQLVQEGNMHGFLRMYWAKKILEWTASPEIALRTGLYFNDRFALDGNDPNGFVGVGWSVMGIHDMGWKERPIFGKIRFMNYAGCKRKFNIPTFVGRYPIAAKNALQAGGIVAAVKPKPKPKKPSARKRTSVSKYAMPKKILK